MIDRAHTLTDKEIERIQRHVRGYYRKAEQDISAELQGYAETVKDKADELLADIKNAKDADDLKKAKKAYQMFFLSLVRKDRRFESSSNRVAERLYKANTDASRYINTRTAGIYAINYNQIAKDIKRKHPQYTFIPMSEEEAERNGDITRQTVDKETDEKWNKQNIAKAIITGALLLYGVNKIIKFVVKSVIRKNQDSINRQASDTMTDAENKGRLDSMEQASGGGIDVKKIWVSVGDDRVRATHVEYDGMSPVDLDYEYNTGLKRPRDPDCSIMAEICNCRCSLKVPE